MSLKPLYIVAAVVIGFLTIVILQNRIKPLKDVDISEYEVMLEEEDYIVYRKSVTSLDGIGLSRSSVTDVNGVYCTFNEYSMKHYIVEHEGKYYNLLDAGKKKIYTCEEIRSLEI